MTGKISWAVLIAFVIFLRLALTNLVTIAQTLIRFSRYFPQVSYYHAFITASELPDEPAGAPVVVTSDLNALSGSEQTMRLVPGDRMAVFCPYKLDRFYFPYAADPAMRAQGGIRIPPRNCAFLGENGLFRESGSVREMLQLHDGGGWAELAVEFDDEKLDALRRALPEDVDQQIGVDQWHQFPLSLRIELSLVSATRFTGRILVVSRNTMSKLDAEDAERLLAKLDHLVLVVTYGQFHFEQNPPVDYSETVAGVLTNTGHIVALGQPDWLHENAAAVRAILVEEKHRERGAKAISSTSEDWDDEDDARL